MLDAKREAILTLESLEFIYRGSGLYKHRFANYIFRASRLKILHYAQYSLWVQNSILTNGKCFSHVIDKSLKF